MLVTAAPADDQKTRQRDDVIALVIRNPLPFDDPRFTFPTTGR